jgi:hypothetical protein
MKVGRSPISTYSRGWEDNDWNGSWGNGIGGRGLDSSGSGYGPVAGCFEHCNEPSDPIKGGGIS